MVPPGRYRRGSVSHSWSETQLIVTENSSPSVGALSPDRLYTPVDELLSAAGHQLSTRGGGDDGPTYNRTSVFTATDYSSSDRR